MSIQTATVSTRTQAVIYCRVSSDRQAKEGDGVRSQEQRCRSYAQMMGYEMLRVFTDDGVSGALIDRPGIQNLLAFLRVQAQETVVIVDDISRIARDVMAHFQLKAAIRAAGGRVESPSFTFGESASDELLETIMAATAQYGRKGNREQVLNRMRSRLELGYWTFPAPVGYHYEKHPLHKKILVPSAKARTILGPALEDFGRGRLQTQRELGLHLQEQGFFDDMRPVSLSVLEKRMMRVMDFLPLYAGQIEYRDWKIERRPAQHEAILSPVGLARIEEKLNKNVHSIGILRADTQNLLPLRNFLRCGACGRPLTGSLAKGKYPRYHCYWYGCPQKRFSYSAKEKVEPAFRQLLESVTPTEALLKVIGTSLPEAWQEQTQERARIEEALRQELLAVQREVGGYVRRLGRVSESLAEDIEREIEGLKTRELELRRRLLEAGESGPKMEEAWERVHTYFSDPLGIWNTGSESEKKTLLRLVFTSPPIFTPEEGVHTSSLSLPYLVSRDFGHTKKGVVDFTGKSSHLFWECLLQWMELIEDGKSDGSLV